MLLIILACVLILLINYFIFIKPHRYWKERGVKHLKPWPLFGSLAETVVFQKQGLPEYFREIYNSHQGERYVAFYQFNLPSLMLRDPELIKQIGVKDFDAFPEHTTFAPKESDPLWAKNLFAMPGGEEWKDIRAVLSPAFTSSKLKTMFGLIVDCAQQFIDYVEKQDSFVRELEMKDTFAKVTNDIIATTAFGVGCDSFKNPNNEIFVMGKAASTFDGFLISMKFFVAAINPTLAKFLNIRFISKPVTEFFRKIVRETVKVRKEQGLIRPDMINLLMEARRGRVHTNGNSNGHTEKRHKTVITDDVMTAQAVVFFLAGFDTVSTAMSYTAYELALNPEIQERLQAEVDETLQICQRKITYDGLMNMKYLDMVVSEALRKWPPFAVTDRKLITNYTIEPRHPDEQPLHLDKKVVCQIPIYALHRDPKYFPNPDKFDPDRFSDENKQNIVPFSYLPFGVGPRNCIGSRFALLEVKLVIFYLMCKFEFVPVEKTSIPLVLSKSNVNPLPEEGFWLGLKSRSNILA